MVSAAVSPKSHSAKLEKRVFGLKPVLKTNSGSFDAA